MINYNFSSYNVGDLVDVKVDKKKEREPETPYFNDFDDKAKQSHKEFEDAKIGAIANVLLMLACIFFIS